METNVATVLEGGCPGVNGIISRGYSTSTATAGGICRVFSLYRQSKRMNMRAGRLLCLQAAVAVA